MKRHICTCFKIIILTTCVGYAHNDIGTSYKAVSFDTLFYPTLYKKTLDESVDLCGELEILHETDTVELVTLDALIGRIVRYLGLVNDLIAYQEKTQAHLQEDGAYIVKILIQMQTLCQHPHIKLYSALLMPLFEQVRQKLSHTFDL